MGQKKHRNPNETPSSSVDISHTFTHNHIATPIETNAKLTTDKRNENVDNMISAHTNNLKEKRQTTIYRRRRKHNRSVDVSDEDADDEEEDEDIVEQDGDNETEEFDENDDELTNNNSHNESNEAKEKNSRDRLDDNTDFRIPFWDTYDSINQLYLQIGE